MIPRIFKRYASSKTGIKKGKKGPLYQLPKPITKSQVFKQHLTNTKTRIMKAERDERVNIGTSLSEVKTYMGGFTRPRDLRCSNWFPGGAYILKNKVYEKPPVDAYVPHMVFLLESRYFVRHEAGKSDCREHIVGVCREKDFRAIMKKYNSKKCIGPAREAMDNAQWPWLPLPRKLGRTRWWEPGEDPKMIVQAILEEEDKAALQTDVTEEDGSLGSELENDITEAAQEPNKPSEPQSDHIKASNENTVSALHKTNQTPSQQNSKNPILKKADVTSTEGDDRDEDYIIDPPADSSQKRRIPAKEREAQIASLRARYEPTLELEPFWRPLLSFSFSTRPLAVTFGRLSRALPRGLAFYASINSDDRKCYWSFTERMRCLRIDRMVDLAVYTSARLSGIQGGLPGIRFSNEDRGRGINGEGLADPIPVERRTIKAGVGKWYARAGDVLECLKDGSEYVEVFEIDELGRRLGAEGNPVTAESEDKTEEDEDEVQLVDDLDGSEVADIEVEDAKKSKSILQITEDAAALSENEMTPEVMSKLSKADIEEVARREARKLLDSRRSRTVVGL